jgi:hypothetical protein
VAVVEITPDIAQHWLSANVANRPTNEATVKHYVSELNRGAWALNGETIVFDRNNHLRNGQHRLKACVETGKSFTTLVVWGVAPETFKTIDTGRMRRGSDALAIAGEHRVTLLSSVLTLITLYGRNPQFPRDDNWVSNGERLAELKAHPEVRDSLQERFTRRGFLAPPAIMAFCHWLFSTESGGKYKSLADQFFDRLCEGDGLSAGMPVRELRLRLQALNSHRATRPDRFFLIALMFKAWRYTKAGESISYIRWRPTEEFPTI